MLFLMPANPMAEQLFQRMLASLKPLCRARDFHRHSQNFVTESPECWGVVNLQKSRYSEPGTKKFTINVAVAAKRVLAFYGEPTHKPPVYYAAHWEQRIGYLLPANRDTWWTLSDDASYPAVQKAVAEAVEYHAIPAVRSLLSEDALLERWRGKLCGGFEYPRLKCQSVLLAERGLLEELGNVIFRMLEITAGGRAAEGVTEHLTKLKAKYSIPDHIG